MVDGNMDISPRLKINRLIFPLVRGESKLERDKKKIRPVYV